MITFPQSGSNVGSGDHRLRLKNSILQGLATFHAAVCSACITIDFDPRVQ